jgi:hypothetical protein
MVSIMTGDIINSRKCSSRYFHPLSPSPSLPLTIYPHKMPVCQNLNKFSNNEHERFVSGLKGLNIKELNKASHETGKRRLLENQERETP